ncbi:MAG: hypothetical protein ACOC2J_03685 [bacterium]
MNKRKIVIFLIVIIFSIMFTGCDNLTKVDENEPVAEVDDKIKIIYKVKNFTENIHFGDSYIDLLDNELVLKMYDSSGEKIHDKTYIDNDNNNDESHTFLQDLLDGLIIIVGTGSGLDIFWGDINDNDIEIEKASENITEYDHRAIVMYDDVEVNFDESESTENSPYNTEARIGLEKKDGEWEITYLYFGNSN